MANAKALLSPALNPINVICLALAIVVLANAAILPRLALVMTTTHAPRTTSATMANVKARRRPVLNPINVICLALAIVVLANAAILPNRTAQTAMIMTPARSMISATMASVEVHPSLARLSTNVTMLAVATMANAALLSRTMAHLAMTTTPVLPMTAAIMANAKALL